MLTNCVLNEFLM